MRPVMSWFAAGLALSIIASCAHQKPAFAPGEGDMGENTVPADSFEAAAYDSLFMERYASLTKELGIQEKQGTPDARLIEARSLVSAGEELYLRGMLDAALRLLDEAARTLKQER